MEDEQGSLAESMQTARIAVYDDMLAAPRVVDIEPSDIRSYIGEIAAKTYDLAQKQGGSIPYAVIREVAENFIHAHFREPCVSILDRGNTIRFTDQGPGIADKERAQLPGFTSATSEMRQYINGVGGGLPIAKEYLRFSNGRLTIEDNIKEGTVITITVNDNAPQSTPVVYQETTPQTTQQPANTAYNTFNASDITPRERSILELASNMGPIGPTEITNNLGIASATAHRDLTKLEKMGLMEMVSGRKRSLTNAGFGIING